MSEPIEVEIEVIRMVRYNTKVKMTKEEYEDLKERLDSDDRKTRSRAESEVNEHIDYNDDWLDDELEEVSSFWAQEYESTKP